MIQILETMVKVEMTLPELRVLRKCLGSISRAHLQDKGFDEREVRVFGEIYKSFDDFIASQS